MLALDNYLDMVPHSYWSVLVGPSRDFPLVLQHVMPESCYTLLWLLYFSQGVERMLSWPLKSIQLTTAIPNKNIFKLIF